MSAAAARVSARLIIIGLALVASTLATPLITNDSLYIYYDPNSCNQSITWSFQSGGLDTIRAYAIGPVEIYDSQGSLLASLSSSSTIYVIEEVVANYDAYLVVHGLDGSQAQQINLPESLVNNPDLTIEASYSYQISATCVSLVNEPLYSLGYPIIVLSLNSSLNVSGGDYETYSFDLALANGTTVTLYLHLLVSDISTVVTYTSGVATYTLTIEPPTTTTATASTVAAAPATTPTSTTSTSISTPGPGPEPWVLEPAEPAQLERLEVSLDAGGPGLPPAASLGLGAAAAIFLIWLLAVRR